MPRFLVKQSKNKFAVFSTIIDKYVILNMPYNFCLKYIMKDNNIGEEEAAEVLSEVKKESYTFSCGLAKIKLIYGAKSLKTFINNIKSKSSSILKLSPRSGFQDDYNYKEITKIEELTND